MWATAVPFTPGHQWVSAMSQGAPGRHPTEWEFGASGRSAQPASSTVLRPPPPGTKDDDVGPLGKRGLRLRLPWKQVLVPCSCPSPFPAHGGSLSPPVLCQTSLPRRPAGQGRALSLASSATRFALHTRTAEQGVGGERPLNPLPPRLRGAGLGHTLSPGPPAAVFSGPRLSRGSCGVAVPTAPPLAIWRVASAATQVVAAPSGASSPTFCGNVPRQLTDLFPQDRRPRGQFPA